MLTNLLCNLPKHLANKFIKLLGKWDTAHIAEGSFTSYNHGGERLWKGVQ